MLLDQSAAFGGFEILAHHFFCQLVEGKASNEPTFKNDSFHIFLTAIFTAKRYHAIA